MNYIQLLLFLVYVFSIYLWGEYIFSLIGQDSLRRSSRALAFGETLLIGSVVSVGILVFLSLVGCYSKFWIWGSVLAAYPLLFNQGVRRSVGQSLLGWNFLSIPNLIFLGFVGIFFLRNFYFLVDVDSHSTYLYVQKLWLYYGSSIISDIGLDQRIFVPHFESVPYGLGISLFNEETLFPQLINTFWRIITLFLVYGYTVSHFKNKYLALAGVFLVLFNEHFFISGANQWSTVNGALIALLFAMVYSVWEVRKNNEPSRFLLGLIFLMHIMACKYQMVLIFFYFFIVFIVVPKKPWRLVIQILQNRKYLCVLILGALFSSLWYIKNYLATGLPTFPVLAWQFGTFGWTKEMGEVFMSVGRGVTLAEFFKYFNYLFVWPGINPLKIVCVSISLMPLFVFIPIIRNRLDQDRLLHLSFWLISSTLILMGICLTCHQDPRYYRYGIAVFSFSALLAVQYIVKDVIGIKQKAVFICLILAFSLKGYEITYSPFWDNFRFPVLSENIEVLMNRKHFKDVFAEHYPSNILINDFFANAETTDEKLAWNMRNLGDASAFLLPLPVRPQIGLFDATTTIVKWDSYGSEELIVKDLKDYGIDKIIQIQDNEVVLITPEELAKN